MNNMKNFNETIVANTLEEAKTRFSEKFPEIEVSNFFDRTKIFKRKSFQEEMDKEMETCENPVGFVAVAQAPIENKNKIKSIFKAVPQKGTRKWHTCYRVQFVNDIDQLVNIPGSVAHNDRSEAIKVAREFTSLNKVPTFVKITKELESKDVDIIANIEYRPAKNERQGTFIFFGKY